MAYDSARAEQELHEAIAAVLAQHGLMVNRWVLITEVIDPEGDRTTGWFTSPDLRQWDSLGLLEFALAQEKGDVYARAARGD